MTVLIKILQVTGLLLLVLLLSVLWLIIIPRKFWVEYSKHDGVIIKVKMAFIKARIYPLPALVEKLMSKKSKKQQTEDKKEKNTKEKRANPFSRLDISFNFMKQVVEGAKGTMKKVFKALEFSDVSFTFPVHGSDAHNTQKIYSAVTSAFYALSITLQKNMKFSYKSPVFIADFADSYGDSVYFYCKITASPILLLSAMLYGWGQYKEITEKYQKNPDKGENTASVTEKEIKNG